MLVLTHGLMRHEDARTNAGPVWDEKDCVRIGDDAIESAGASGPEYKHVLRSLGLDGGQRGCALNRG